MTRLKPSSVNHSPHAASPYCVVGQGHACVQEFELAFVLTADDFEYALTPDTKGIRLAWRPGVYWRLWAVGLLLLAPLYTTEHLKANALLESTVIQHVEISLGNTSFGPVTEHDAIIRLRNATRLKFGLAALGIVSCVLLVAHPALARFWRRRQGCRALAPTATGKQ